MLGRLARWLRFMGYHVIYASEDMTDDQIVLRCREESLVLLSRDRELTARLKSSIRIDSGIIDVQLRQFLKHFRPDPDRMMTVCPVCDGNLEIVGKEEIKGKVPENVYRLNEMFWICSGCGKVYWKGTHFERILKKISELTED